MDGGSGTLDFEKVSDLPFARLRQLRGPALDIANGGDRSNDVVTCDSVTTEGLAQPLNVQPAAAACSVAAVAGGTASVSASTPMATVEVGVMPAPLPFSTLAISSANCTCNC
jgi:hypothetical protein